MPLAGGFTFTPRDPPSVTRPGPGAERFCHRRPPSRHAADDHGHRPGATIDDTLGLVKGNTVRARNIGRDITQSLRNITGGELESYSGLMTQSRDEAVDRLVATAEDLGADAVVSVRFETSEITQGAAEILVYGTAVTLE